MRKLTPGSVLLGFAALAVIALLRSDGMAGREAPGFSLRGAYGGRVDLSDYRGRPVLLVFWTTGCGICRRELPVIDRVCAEFNPAGLAAVAINLGDVNGAREFMRANKLRLTNLVDVEDQTARRYGVRGVPKLVLVGRDGKIRKTHTGSQGEGQLRAWLRGVGRKPE